MSAFRPSFQLAGGSVLGTDHRALPKNNQDAWYVARARGSLVAVVCDGCGSGAYSEVGAQLGARLIAETTLRYALTGTWSFDRVRDDVLAQLRVLALQLGGSFYQTVEDYFLFTVLGVSLTGYTARFFSLGDGVFIINGEVERLGPFPNNEPPYLGYALFDDPELRELEFSVGHHKPLDELNHFLLGCDGAVRLLEVCERNPSLPGVGGVKVGPISQFWEDDCYFSNPVAVSRRLKLIARDWPPRNPERGLLDDDTTIIVGRRLREA